MFVGFDFPIGVPAHYAARAGVAKFRELLPQLGKGDWSDFFSVCDAPEQISVHRPFYPDGQRKGRKQEDLCRGHGVSSMKQLLRRCELGGKDRREAGCLFWILGPKQVGKAAISGWRDVLIPAIQATGPVYFWPFDGPLSLLFARGSMVIAETYPAECYEWLPGKLRGSKRAPNSRKEFCSSWLSWAARNEIIIDQRLQNEICNGFPTGGDDAFDAVVGLLGMIQLCMRIRSFIEPTEADIVDIEGWILGR